MSSPVRHELPLVNGVLHEFHRPVTKGEVRTARVHAAKCGDVGLPLDTEGGRPPQVLADVLWNHKLQRKRLIRVACEMQ